MKIVNCKLKIITHAFTALLVIGTPLFMDAATLYFESPDSLLVGETAEVRLLLDPEGETINAVEGKVRFTETLLEVSRIHTGDSLVDLWVVPPRIEDGAIVFSGITPGGFSGIQETGSGALLPGVVATFIVRGESAGTALFSLSESRVLAHDGGGTPLLVVLKSKEIKINGKGPARTTEVVQSGGQEIGDKESERIDTTPPEPFEVIITRDSALHDNQWTAIFTTQDKETGVDYYEIAESNRRMTQNEAQNDAELEWIRAESPYLLKNQRETHHVYVKAVDNAGNIRIAHAGSSAPFGSPVDKKIFLLLAFVIITTLLLTVFFRKKYYTKTR